MIILLLIFFIIPPYQCVCVTDTFYMWFLEELFIFKHQYVEWLIFLKMPQCIFLFSGIYCYSFKWPVTSISCLQVIQYHWRNKLFYIFDHVEACVVIFIDHPRFNFWVLALIGTANLSHAHMRMSYFSHITIWQCCHIW